MSNPDIPLHYISSNSRSRPRYASPTDSISQGDDHPGRTDMHTAALRSAAAGRGFGSGRSKGKGKQREQYPDESDEEATLLLGHVDGDADGDEDGDIGGEGQGSTRLKRLEGSQTPRVRCSHSQIDTTIVDVRPRQRSSTLSRTRSKGRQDRTRTIPFRPPGRLVHLILTAAIPDRLSLPCVVLGREISISIPPQHRSQPKVQHIHLLPGCFIRTVQVLFQSVFPAGGTFAVHPCTQDWCAHSQHLHFSIASHAFDIP